MDLFEFKVENIKKIKNDTENLIKECHSLLRLIDVKGVDGNYSINTRIGQYADDIRKRMTVMGYVNTFNLDITNKEKK